jgi:hypothetical protein
MRFLGLNMLLATWLMISAFALPQTPTTSMITWITAILVPAVALSAPAKPGARYVISAIAVFLGFAALLVPGPGIAALNNALVAALFFALSLVKPVSHAREAEAH